MKSFCWNSKNKDRRYYAEDWARCFAQFISNGVYAATATNMQVQADGGRNVRIAVGSCFIDGRTGYAEGDDVLTLDYGGGGPRIDRIVARMDVAKKEIQPQIIKGEVAEEPTAPDIIRNGSYYDLCLAEITVPANATVITQADIRDTRFDDELCGVVAGVIKQISTSGFLAQYEAEWELLRAACAQDEQAVIEAWAALNTTKKINGIVPIDGEITLTQADVPSGGGYYQLPYKVLSGQVTINGTVTITFDEEFLQIPTVIATPQYNRTDKVVGVSFTEVSTTGFTAVSRNISINSQANNTEGTLHWVAFGK